MLNILSIALGGGIGAVTRYLLSKIISAHFGAVFPWGTLTVNLTGSLLIGFFFGMFDRISIPGELRAFITMGFIGAFTTFSTFALESINLIRDGEIRLGLLNIAASNLAGIVCVVIGMYLSGVFSRN